MWAAAASGIVLLGCSILLCVFAFGRWISDERKASFAQLVRAGGRDDKWSHVFLAAILLGIDSVIGEGQQPMVLRRVAANLVLILCLVLATAGVYSKSFLGFTETPWEAYDTDVTRMASSLDSKKEEIADGESRIDRLVTAARATHWKYVYTVVASTLALVAYLGCFQFVARATRYSIREMDTARSWIQKAGIVYLFVLATALAAVVFAFTLGFLTSILPSSAIYLALMLGESVRMLTVIVVISALFEFYFGGPWFKAFVFAGLLPCITFLLLVLPALTADLLASSYRSARTAAVSVAYRGLGNSTVPLLLVVALLYVVSWSMSKLL